MVAAASDFADGHRVELHRHSRAQLLHALTGVVMVATRSGRWMVPPDHAMWIPAGTDHSVEVIGDVRMRSAYVLTGAVPGLPQRLRVLAMSGLMRALIVEAVKVGTGDGDERAAAIMHLLLQEVAHLEERPFALPMPADPRLARLCRSFLAAPTPHITIDGWAAAAGMSRRSFTRSFQRETGISLSVWRRQATLFAALPRLAAGDTVTNVALDLGYDSAPAFTTMFRQTFGASPRRYRQSRRDAVEHDRIAG